MTSSPSVSYGDFKFTEPEDKYFHRVQGLEFESILVSFQNKLHVSGTAVLNSAITGKGMVTAVGELVSNFWLLDLFSKLLHGMGVNLKGMRYEEHFLFLRVPETQL